MAEKLLKVGTKTDWGIAAPFPSTKDGQIPVTHRDKSYVLGQIFQPVPVGHVGIQAVLGLQMHYKQFVTDNPPKYGNVVYHDGCVYACSQHRVMKFTHDMNPIWTYSGLSHVAYTVSPVGDGRVWILQSDAAKLFNGTGDVDVDLDFTPEIGSTNPDNMPYDARGIESNGTGVCIVGANGIAYYDNTGANQWAIDYSNKAGITFNRAGESDKFSQTASDVPTGDISYRPHNDEFMVVTDVGIWFVYASDGSVNALIVLADGDNVRIYDQLQKKNDKETYAVKFNAGIFTIDDSYTITETPAFPAEVYGIRSFYVCPNGDFIVTKESKYHGDIMCCSSDGEVLWSLDGSLFETGLNTSTNAEHYACPVSGDGLGHFYILDQKYIYDISKELVLKGYRVNQ